MALNYRREIFDSLPLPRHAGASLASEKGPFGDRLATSNESASPTFHVKHAPLTLAVVGHVHLWRA